MGTGVLLQKEGREARPCCTPAAGMLWDAVQNPALLSALPFKPKLPKATGIIKLGKRMNRSYKSHDADGCPC